MRVRRLINSRGLPKTGQTVVYQAGDDGTYQAGWWRGDTIAANRVRFKVWTIGANSFIIDKATGLMWPKNFSGDGGNGAVTDAWIAGITWALGLTFGGFTDWRIPNLFELFSIVNLSLSNPCVPAIFENVVSGGYWCSTTTPGDADTKFKVSLANSAVTGTAAFLDNQLIVVRNKG